MRSLSLALRQARQLNRVPKRVGGWVAGVAALLGGLSSAAVIFLVLLIMYGVSMRYLANRPPIFVDEISAYLLVWVVFFGVAHTFRQGGHVRVEVLVSRFPDRVRLWLRGITLLLGTGYSAVLAWQAWELVSSSRAFSFKSFFLQVPAYLPQSLIFIGSVVLGIALAVELVRHSRYLIFTQRRQKGE